jgi:ferredoxin
MNQRSVTALREDFALALDEGACLPLRSRFGQCQACALACPVDALSVSIEAVRLADACIGCGRCVAACPVDALALPGVDEALGAPPALEWIEVECAKVPGEQLAPGAVQVPCLGALSNGRLLELWSRSAESDLTLIDRGWCGSCSAHGCPGHPAQPALDAARLWLAQIGVAAERVPRLEARPLDPASMPDSIPSLTPEPEFSRRAFFRAVVDRPAGRSTPTPMGAGGRAAHPPRTRRRSRERQRLLVALDTVAGRESVTLPSELFPRVSNMGRCVDHRVCVGACPTGALSVREANGGAALEFTGEACIACGACVRACPESALTLEPHGGTRSVIVLAMHEHRPCADCGTPFAPTDAADAVCLSCRKSRRFMTDAMHQLFGNR